MSKASPAVIEGEKIEIKSASTIKFTLSWKADKDSQLDLACVCVDANGQFVDFIYAGNSESKDEAVDQNVNGDGGIELTINLTQVGEAVDGLAIIAHSSGNSLASLAAKIKVVDEKKKELKGAPSSSSPLISGGGGGGGGGSKHANSFIYAKIVRTAKYWKATTVGKAVDAKAFSDLLAPTQDAFRGEFPTFTPLPRLTSTYLIKGETINLHDKSASGKPASRFFIGVSWGLMGAKVAEFDATAILCSKQTVVDAVNSQQPGAKEKTGVWYGGEHPTNGDDERILIDLNAISDSVDSVFVVLNSTAGHRLDSISHVLARVVESEGNKEVARLAVAGVGSKKHHTLLLLKFFRSSNKDWQVKSLAFSGTGRAWKDSQNDIKQEIQGTLSLRDVVDGLKFLPPHSAPITRPQNHPGRLWNFLIVLLAVIFVLVLLDRNNKNITRR